MPSPKSFESSEHRQSPRKPESSTSQIPLAWHIHKGGRRPEWLGPHWSISFLESISSEVREPSVLMVKPLPVRVELTSSFTLSVTAWGLMKTKAQLDMVVNSV